MAFALLDHTEEKTTIDEILTDTFGTEKDNKMIKVPFMKMPECCDKCDFGRLRFSHPFWSKDKKTGKYGYNCQLEYYEKGKYETVREAPIDEHIVPVLCPLIKANGFECNVLTPLENDYDDRPRD